tara:strand:- start:263 stop:694 length:432 start_codon:yes stop_codon:yes gene_type:complete
MDKKRFFYDILEILGYATILAFAYFVAFVIGEHDSYLGGLCFLGLFLSSCFAAMWGTTVGKYPNLFTIITGMILNFSLIIVPDMYSYFKKIYSVESFHLTVMILILSLTVQFIVGNDEKITAGARTYFTSNLLLVIYCFYLAL